MADTAQTLGLVADPKRLLRELAALHQLSELLPLAVQRMSESSSVALVRIWLTQPPFQGDCARCRFVAECPSRERCLHLMASSGRSLADVGEKWQGLDGAFRRFPIGVRKVGRIAATGQSLEVPQVELDPTWVANPDWIALERITSFVGHPLVHRGQVLGVLGVFARRRHLHFAKEV